MAPKLFTPTQVGALTLKHRVVMAPLTRNRADPQTLVPSNLSIEYYGQRASGKLSPMGIYLPLIAPLADNQTAAS